MTFAELGLIPELVRAVSEQGYTTPTPIQSQAIPAVLAGQDVMGGAQTGTGKTAGFVLPILQNLAPNASTSTSPARHPVQALILAPTRELALQVFESVVTYSRYLPLRAVCLYGGVDIQPQIQELRRGVEIVVATPGRLFDHLQQKSINLGQVRFVVLDEADRMLDMGFLPDISRILDLLPTPRQSLLFSATFSKEIRKLADQLLNNPQLIEVSQRNAVADTITHVVHPVEEAHKSEALAWLIKQLDLQQALVFVDKKETCGRLALWLQKQGITADAIHGDKSQQERIRTLDSFKNNGIRILVATDVAARGLDIDSLPHVINFVLPHVAEDYVHRIGRTGRGGKTGHATSFVANDEDLRRLSDIEKMIKKDIERVPLTGFSPKAHTSTRSTSRPPRSTNAPTTRATTPASASDEGETSAQRSLIRMARASSLRRRQDHQKSGANTSLPPLDFDVTQPYESFAQANPRNVAQTTAATAASKEQSPALAALLLPPIKA